MVVVDVDGESLVAVSIVEVDREPLTGVTVDGDDAVLLRPPSSDADESKMTFFTLSVPPFSTTNML